MINFNLLYFLKTTDYYVIPLSNEETYFLFCYSYISWDLILLSNLSHIMNLTVLRKE